MELYRRWDSPGDPLLINLQGPAIPNKVPSDHEIRDAARDLPSGRVGGASKMCAEDIKRWLRSITLEEDPKKEPNNMGEGNNWRLLVGLIQAIWMQGKNPAAINLGDCGAAPKGWWGLPWNRPFRAAVDSGGAHHGPGTKCLAAP